MSRLSSPTSAILEAISPPPHSAKSATSRPRPKNKLGPHFASDNDPHPDEEAFSKAPSTTVDEEIDELLSDNEDVEPGREVAPPVGVEAELERAIDDGGGAEGSASRVGSENGRSRITGVTKRVVTANGEPSLVCRWDSCGRELDETKQLVEHVQVDHIGQGKDVYACGWDECIRKGQKQASRHSLVTHVRAHTGERPYSCKQPNCGKTFTRSDALNKHLRSLHHVTTKPPDRKGKGAGATALTVAEPLPSPSIDNNEHDSLRSPPISPRSAMTKRATPPASPTRQHESHSQPSHLVPSKRVKLSGPPELPAVLIPGRIAPTVLLHEPVQELYEDDDLETVLPRLAARDRFWDVSDDDEPALATIRTRWRSNPDRAEEDLLDEELGVIVPEPEVIGVTVVAEQLGQGQLQHRAGREVPVMSRSQWQMRYMMGKAKMMLLEEENAMRRRDLETALLEEAQIDQETASMAAAAAAAAIA